MIELLSVPLVYLLCGFGLVTYARDGIEQEMQQAGFVGPSRGAYAFIALVWPLVILGEIYARLTGVSE